MAPIELKARLESDSYVHDNLDHYYEKLKTLEEEASLELLQDVFNSMKNEDYKNEDYGIICPSKDTLQKIKFLFALVATHSFPEYLESIKDEAGEQGNNRYEATKKMVMDYNTFINKTLYKLTDHKAITADEERDIEEIYSNNVPSLQYMKKCFAESEGGGGANGKPFWRAGLSASAKANVAKIYLNLPPGLFYKRIEELSGERFPETNYNRIRENR